MADSALKEALRRLLAHGDAAQDAKMMKMGKKPEAEAPVEPCPKCSSPMEQVDGAEKCPKCGYEEAGDDADLASTLEQGAQEG